MLGVPPRNSARNMFVNSNVRSLQEVLRFATYSLSTCIEQSTNAVLTNIASSDASFMSSVRYFWNTILYTS